MKPIYYRDECGDIEHCEPNWFNDETVGTIGKSLQEYAQKRATYIPAQSVFLELFPGQSDNPMLHRCIERFENTTPFKIAYQIEVDRQLARPISELWNMDISTEHLVRMITHPAVSKAVKASARREIEVICPGLLETLQS